jgi:hypothetical protein
MAGPSGRGAAPPPRTARPPISGRGSASPWPDDDLPRGPPWSSPPRRQMRGHEPARVGVLSRPTFMRNHTPSAACGCWSLGPRSLPLDGPGPVRRPGSPGPSRRWGGRRGCASRSAAVSGSSSGAGRRARWERTRAATSLAASCWVSSERAPPGPPRSPRRTARRRPRPDASGRGRGSRRGRSPAPRRGAGPPTGTSARRRSAGGGDEHHADALAPGAPGAAAAVLQDLGIAGRSAWTTRSSAGRSSPRAATSVATSTRARPSRSACSAQQPLGLGQLGR